MKAADIRLRGVPPRIFTLGPSSFSTRWTGRPKEPTYVGLRIAGADERMNASTEATVIADRRLPEIVRRVHDRTQDPCWAATYEVAWIHCLLGYVLCSPQDVNAPLWAEQDGARLLHDVEPTEPGGAAVVSARFSDNGIARLWDEYDALCIKESEIWPESSPDELRRLGVRLVDGSFFADLDEAAKAGDEEARHVAAQLRRLFHYTVHLRTHGRESAVPQAA